jgi:hypothetical protein
MEPNNRYGKDSTMASLVDTMIRRMGPMNVGKYLAADYKQSQSIERNDFQRLTSESKSDGVDFILTKIYGYLEKRYNQDKLKDELDSNKLEEKELASKRRHDKLLDALRKLKLKVEIKSDNIETQAPSFGLPPFGGFRFGPGVEGRRITEREKPPKEKPPKEKPPKEKPPKGTRVSKPNPPKTPPPKVRPQKPKSKIRIAAGVLLDRLKGLKNTLGKMGGLAGSIYNKLAIAEMIYDATIAIEKAIRDRDDDKIDDTEMKRRITEALGSVSGGIGGAELGAILGGIIGTPVGLPVITGIIGSAAGGKIGSAVGGKIAKAIFDTFQDDNPDLEKLLKNIRMQMKYGDDDKEPLELSPEGDYNVRNSKDTHSGGHVVSGRMLPAGATNPNPVKGLGTQTVSGKITTRAEEPAPASPEPRLPPIRRGKMYIPDAPPPEPPPVPARRGKLPDPVPPATTSRLESVIGTNREMKLSAMTPKDESVVIDNRTQVASPKDNSTPMLSLPPVRNPEKAYRSVIQYNTRVV